MPVERFSFTMNPELGAAVRRAAEEEGVSVSAWLEEAAAERLRDKLLREWLDEFEAEHGAFTEDESAAARATLGLPPLQRSPDP